VGDRVFGEGTATLADRALAPADQLMPIPTGMGFCEAATLPLAATTALLCLDAAEPAPSDGVLINGASGGVGTFATQLARSMGLHVAAVVSPRTQADVVVDFVANRSLSDHRRVVRSTVPSCSLAMDPPVRIPIASGAHFETTDTGL
jgi:NADPH:quinone reductase-like Zn-dependent oxidoreductase